MKINAEGKGRKMFCKRLLQVNLPSTETVPHFCTVFSGQSARQTDEETSKMKKKKMVKKMEKG